MNKTYLDKLEYNKIIAKLESHCITYIGKHNAKALIPSNSADIVKNSLAETNEGLSILYKASTPPIDEIANITEYLKILESGGSLSLKGILDLTKILNIAHNLKIYFEQDFISNADFPILTTYFNNLYLNKSITDKVFKIVIDENTIADDASSKLKNIRRNIRNQETNIKGTLLGILQKSSKYIQENIITIRNDRYVIPIKEEYRSQIKGLVHDVSSTGSTVFIEPLSVFELNNEINNLKIEEKLEIEHIIRKLSTMFTPYTEQLETNSNIIGHLDFIFAKAKYSKQIEATCPTINTEKYFNLKNVRHPLLDSNVAVPINISVGQDFSSLIITGPNTGGKTVSLKTVGIIHLMACSGLNIPADEGSSIYIFDNIFADIGDDQSISDSLSTFSSHILNIVDIIKCATQNSLILVDELGSGTDPIEGANLAISILEYFKSIDAITIATTHYQELKKYALTTKGFENASVEFDIETLSPTYKLLIGIPGKSNAFEISKKLGLSTQIIEKAQSLMNSNDVKFETILKNIYDDKIQIENDKQKMSAELKEIEILKERLIKEDTEKTEKANNIINNAKQDARRILIDAKEDVNEMIKQINETSSSKELNNIRNSLNEKIKGTLPTSSKNVINNDSIDKTEIKPNLKVFITTLNKEGIVISNISKSNEVMVQIGNMKMNINIENLQKSKTSIDKPKSNYSYNISKSRTINSEINVIGENVLDATMIIDKFLDDCSLAKLQTVRIVHGKGTGKLKNGIHAFLRTNPHVKSFRIGTFGEGEMGVTIVELK